MFYEWVARGAQIGITAFFAIFVFLAFVAALLGLVALAGSFFKAGSGERDDMGRH